MLGLLTDYGVMFLALAAVAYFGPAGFFHLLFRKAARDRRIQPRGPHPRQVAQEIRRSLLSLAWFAAYGVLLLHAYRAGWTALEPDWNALPWWWQAGAFLLAVVALDTWFYWVHRLMHTRLLFRWVHAEHHRSLVPTPWSSLRFDLADTAQQFAFFAALVFLVPMHPAVLCAYVAFHFFVNALGHCGHEVIPEWQRDAPVLSWINVVSHHDLHHARFDCNFSQYFTVWDRLCGTFRDRQLSAQKAGKQPSRTATREIVPGE